MARQSRWLVRLVRDGYLHHPARARQRAEAVTLVQGVGVGRPEQEPAQSLQVRVGQHRLDQPLAEAAAAVSVEHEHVGQLRDRRAVGDRAREARPGAVAVIEPKQSELSIARSMISARDAAGPVGVVVKEPVDRGRGRVARVGRDLVAVAAHATSRSTRAPAALARLRPARRRRRCCPRTTAPSPTVAPCARRSRTTAPCPIVHGRPARVGPTSALARSWHEVAGAAAGSMQRAGRRPACPRPAARLPVSLDRASEDVARRLEVALGRADVEPVAVCGSMPYNPLPTSAGNTSRSNDTARRRDQVEHLALEHVGAGVDRMFARARRPAASR